MGEVRHRPGALAGLLGLAEELVGTGGRALYLRCLHHQEDSLDLVEELEERDRAQCDELGGCTCIRFGGRIFREPVFLPELCHPFVVVGEVIVGGRLLVREQG